MCFNKSVRLFVAVFLVDLVLGAKPTAVGIILTKENSGQSNRVYIGETESLVATLRFPDGVTQDVNVAIKASVSTTVFTISELTRYTVGSDIGTIQNTNWFSHVALTPATGSDKTEGSFDLGDVTNDGPSSTESNSYIKIYFTIKYVSIAGYTTGTSYSPKVTITHGPSGTSLDSSTTYVLYGQTASGTGDDDDDGFHYDSKNWMYLLIGISTGLLFVGFFTVSMFLMIRDDKDDDDDDDVDIYKESDQEIHVTRVYHS